MIRTNKWPYTQITISCCGQTGGWLSRLLAPFSSPPPRKLKVIPLAPQSPVASVTHSTHNPASSNFSHPSTREGLTDGAIGDEAEAYAQAKFAGERQPSAVSSGDDSELNHSQGTTGKRHQNFTGAPKCVERVQSDDHALADLTHALLPHPHTDLRPGSPCFR
jgi:hypothetical protein